MSFVSGQTKNHTLMFSLTTKTIKPTQARVVARRAKGFSYLELVFVIGLISVLLGYGITKLWALQADGERVAMEQIVGTLRSALGMSVATHLVKNDMGKLRAMERSNPMNRLAEVPANYIGEVDETTAVIQEGTWYFDTRTRYLVYRVRNAEYFESGLGRPARARFVVQLVGEQGQVEGVRLIPVEAYRWTK